MTQQPWQKWLWGLLGAGLIGVVLVYFLQPEPPAPLGMLRPAGTFSLTNQLGAPVTERDVWGDVVVANVIFSRCPTQCHRLSQLMARVQRRIPTGVRLISLTADPGYDTPEVLARYGQKHGAQTDKWWFLTGPKPEVYQHATSNLLFTVLESPDPAHTAIENLFIHSTDFAILDTQARLRAVVHGEDADAEEQILARVRQLLSR